jgi:hypothetical protein
MRIPRFTFRKFKLTHRKTKVGDIYIHYFCGLIFETQN